jgi:hypothetical protein
MMFKKMNLFSSMNDQMVTDHILLNKIAWQGNNRSTRSTIWQSSGCRRFQGQGIQDETINNEVGNRKTEWSPCLKIGLIKEDEDFKNSFDRDQQNNLYLSQFKISFEKIRRILTWGREGYTRKRYWWWLCDEWWF